MQQTESRITTRDGASLKVTTFAPDGGAAGNTVDVVLLHGWPNAGGAWAWVAEAMLLTGVFRLHAPDLRGFGGSDRSAAGYTCEGFADDVEDVIRGLGLTRYAVFGHSMGGKVALAFAGRRPEGLSALLLLSPALPAGPLTPEERKEAQRALYGDETAIRNALLPGMAAHGLKPERLDELTRQALAASPAAWNGWVDVMRDEDVSAAASAVSAPTLVVHGGKDPLRTEEGLRAGIVDVIPGARLETLPGVGHLAHVEEPSGLAILAVNFLEGATP